MCNSKRNIPKPTYFEYTRSIGVSFACWFRPQSDTCKPKWRTLTSWSVKVRWPTSTRQAGPDVKEPERRTTLCCTPPKLLWRLEKGSEGCYMQFRKAGFRKLTVGGSINFEVARQLNIFFVASFQYFDSDCNIVDDLLCVLMLQCSNNRSSSYPRLLQPVK